MFYDIFLDLCNRNGEKPGPAAEACGINRSNVSLWKSKGYTPRGEALQAIANHFGVTVDYLLGKGEKEDNKSPKVPVRTASDKELQFALFGGEVTDEAYEEVKAFAAYVKEKYKKKGS